MKLDILAFAAHPDDVELSCSGTIAKEISLGKRVGIVDFTQGELEVEVLPHFVLLKLMRVVSCCA